MTFDLSLIVRGSENERELTFSGKPLKLVKLVLFFLLFVNLR